MLVLELDRALSVRLVTNLRQGRESWLILITEGAVTRFCKAAWQSWIRNNSMLVDGIVCGRAEESYSCHDVVTCGRAGVCCRAGKQAYGKVEQRCSCHTNNITVYEWDRKR